NRCCRRTEAGNRSDVFGSGTQRAFLTAALDQRLSDMNIAAANERAHALRPAELMRGKTHEIGAEFVHPASNTARTLHRVNVQHAICGMHDVRDLRNRLDNAGFVIGEHDRYKWPLGPSNGRSKSMKID